MELKYSLLSGDEICGSSEGFCRFMSASISYILISTLPNAGRIGNPITGSKIGLV
jgi:hypothetical protein